jgi:CRP-like cAMP-binding protein
MSVHSLDLNMDKESCEILLDLKRFGLTVQKHPNQKIYSPDKTANSVFYLTKGYVRLFDQTTGKSIVIGVGDLFGDRSILHSKNIYAEALTTIEYIQIDREGYKRLFKYDTSLALNLMTNISKHFICKEQKQSRLLRIKEFFKRDKSERSEFTSSKIKNKKENTVCLN